MKQYNTYLCWILPVLVLSLGCTQEKEPEVAAAPVEAPDVERIVALDGQPNFRDHGGDQTADGR